MREITFRGKTIDNGDWLYGDLWHKPYGGSNIAIVSLIDDSGTMGGRNVIPETVGQYTGLTDRNGNKIFEGDIVESKFTKKLYLVCFGEYTYTDEYGEESGAYGWYNEEEGGYLTAFSQPDCWATIVGNIHDNPELLKGDQT